MVKILRCASCGRTAEESDGVKILIYEGEKWCTSCAAIKKTPKGTIFVSIPSPGRMYESANEDALSAWKDCYLRKPKKRILAGKAKNEIQIAWDKWDQDKTDSSSMFSFFCWLQKYRPYFLTFRCKCDPWQKIHGWLVEYEEQK